MVFHNATDPQRLLALYYYNSIGPHFADFPKEGLLTPTLLDPNYVPPSISNQIVGCTVSLTAIALLVVSMRCYVLAFWPNTRFGTEDAFFIMAATTLGGYAAVMLMSVFNGGLGHHTYDLEAHELQTAWRYNLPLLVLYISATLFSKFSNLFFLLRICPKSSIWTRRCIKGVLYFGTMEATTSIFLYVFPCKPVSASWDLAVRLQNPKCLDMVAIAYATNIMFVATDFWVLLIPLAVVPALNLPRRTTIAISGLWLLGLVACLACAFKIRYFVELYTSYDASWVAGKVAIWSVIELTLSLITVTLPTIDMLLVKMIPISIRDRLANWDSRRESQSKTLGSSAVYSVDRGMDQEKLDFVQELDPRTKMDKQAHLQSYVSTGEHWKNDHKMRTASSRQISQQKDADVADAYEQYLRYEQEKEKRDGKSKTGKRLSLHEFTAKSLSVSSPKPRSSAFDTSEARTQSLSKLIGAKKSSQVNLGPRTRSWSNLRSQWNASNARLGSASTPARGQNYGQDYVSSDETATEATTDGDFETTSDTETEKEYDCDNGYSTMTATPRVQSMISDTQSDSAQSHLDVVGRSFLNI